MSKGLNQNQINEESNALFTGANYIDLDAEALIAYEQIRQMPREHLATVAIHSEAPESVVVDVFNHIFIREHQMPIGPNQFQQTRFAPDPDIGRLWLAASQRLLSPDELGEIQRLLAHEHVEQTLMARGLPYRSPHPEAWPYGSFAEGGTNSPKPGYYGAHDVAPSANSPKEKPEPFFMWKKLGLSKDKLPAGEPNLFQLDLLVNAIINSIL